MYTFAKLFGLIKIVVQCDYDLIVKIIKPSSLNKSSFIGKHHKNCCLIKMTIRHRIILLDLKFTKNDGKFLKKKANKKIMQVVVDCDNHFMEKFGE